MNFVKRAGLSLSGRRSRTAALLGVFVVICALLLGGFLLRGAAARQEADAQRAVGVDVTVGRKGLTADLADRLDVPGLVHRYTAELPVRAVPRGFTPLTSGGPGAGGGGRRERGALEVHGVRDLGLLLPFSYGSTRITSGRGIGPGDAGAHVAVIERRLAERNGLAVGDTLRLRSADGRRSAVSRIVGVFRDPTRDPARPMPSHMLPGNLLYVPMASARRLGTGPARVDRAVYRIGSPDRAERLHAEAVRVLGGGGLRFTVNDKAYRDQVRPIQRVGAFADLVVHVIALAGALILSLLVTLQVRERRGELGVLLALGEKKWKLLGQHVVEVAAVALPALALAALAGALGGQRVGDAFLDHHGDGDTDSRSSSGSGSGSGSGTVAAGAPDTPLAPPTVRVGPADLGRVAGIALGISLVATVVPGIGVLRLHPRSLLLDAA
ncbi:ABC transporter permease [Streptomyces griseoaurantiacus]|uniref:ABC transporter permease n=1 Tax=Streptomyces griseoaurantiacus TaxID=68213 RepID=UPI002E2C5D09|nr:FtsX-like permease family protein [Streptomyces jietaisiensis]